MVWIFGDSFSAPFDGSNKWSSDYIKWKGYKPKTFGDIIAEKLGVGAMNIAKNGTCNDSIHESICENINEVREGDIIIIGWSNIRRFRLANKSGKWENVLWSGLYKTLENLQDISEETVEQIFINRTSPLYNDEFMKRINFLNWAFRNNIILHWTPFPEQFEMVQGFLDIESIQMETGGEVQDTHYSELGHRQVAERILGILKF